MTKDIKQVGIKKMVGGKMKKHEILKESWVWNETVTKYINDLIHPNANVLNVPCGKSKIGNVRLDMDQENNPTIIGDMNNLPFQDNTFDIVIQDPPWKIGFYNRMKPFFECVRVCKVGGLIIYNAYWIPSTKYEGLLEDISFVIRQDKSFTNTSIISVFKKLKEVPR